jgi:hypothetical protein
VVGRDDTTGPGNDLKVFHVFELCPWGQGQVVLSPPATEDIRAVGHGSGSRQGIGWHVAYKKKMSFESCDKLLSHTTRNFEIKSHNVTHATQIKIYLALLDYLYFDY